MNIEFGNLLDLPPLTREDDFGIQETSISVIENDQTRNEVIQIGDDNIVFRANVDSYSTRSCNSMNMTSRIYQHAGDINKEISSTLTAMIEETKDLPCGPYVEEFNKYLAKMSSHQTIGLVKIGTAKIARELTKPSLPPMINTKPHGFFAKLLNQ